MKKMTWEQRCQNGYVPFRNRVPNQDLTEKLLIHWQLHCPWTPLDRILWLRIGEKWSSISWLAPARGCCPEINTHQRLMMNWQIRALLCSKKEEEEEKEKEKEGGEEEEGNDDGGKEEEEEEQDEAQADEEPREKGEEKEDPSLITFRLAIPMSSKDQKTVLSTTQEMYIQLRVMGYHVSRLHTDFSRWPQACNYMSMNVNDDGWLTWIWLMSLLLVMSCWFAFGRPSHWKPPTRRSYLAPRPDAHGHLVRKDDGTTAIVPYIVHHEDPRSHLDGCHKGCRFGEGSEEKWGHEVIEAGRRR